MESKKDLNIVWKMVLFFSLLICLSNQIYLWGRNDDILDKLEMGNSDCRAIITENNQDMRELLKENETIKSQYYSVNGQLEQILILGLDPKYRMFEFVKTLSDNIKKFQLTIEELNKSNKEDKN